MGFSWKYVSAQKLAIYSALFGFFFSYLSAISVFQYGEILESGSTSITQSLFGNEVKENVISSSSATLLDATTSKLVVNIDGSISYYNDLESAIAAAPNNKEYTITLLRNIEVGNEVKIPSNKKIIIDGNSKYSIIRSKKSDGNWHTDRIFFIDDNAELLLKDITFDMNNNWTINNEDYSNALQKQDIFSNKRFVTPELSSPVATNYVFYNNGTLNMDGVTIENHYSENYGIIYGNEGSKTTIKNSLITKCATNGSGVIASVSGNNALINIEEGTMINNNFAGNNGGMFAIYSGAKLMMNGGEITNNKSFNSNGFIVMTKGINSTFVLNDGLISENTALAGKNNRRNGAIYINSGSIFEMNGGIIENNIGYARGAVDVANANVELTLNSGVIRNNQTYTSFENYNGITLSDNYNTVIGNDMIINDNLFVTDKIVVNGKINGNIIIDLINNNKNIVSGNGSINGDLIIMYKGETIPTINTKIVRGNVVKCNKDTQVMITFEYNGGIDKDSNIRTIISQDIDMIPELPTPEKPGYSLTWYTDKELTTVWEPKNVNENITLYAGWKINQYTVTWDINSSIITRKFNYEELIEMPEDPTKTGYIFTGWSNYTEGMTMPDKDITFKAEWTIDK